MEILNSISNFFSSTKSNETEKFEAVSESSIKINFKDYLHDVMDEAASVKQDSIHFALNKEDFKLANTSLKEEFHVDANTTPSFEIQSSREAWEKSSTKETDEYKTNDSEFGNEVEEEFKVLAQNREDEDLVVEEEVETKPAKDSILPEKQIAYKELIEEEIDFESTGKVKLESKENSIQVGESISTELTVNSSEIEKLELPKEKNQSKVNQIVSKKDENEISQNEIEKIETLGNKENHNYKNQVEAVRVEKQAIPTEKLDSETILKNYLSSNLETKLELKSEIKESLVAAFNLPVEEKKKDKKEFVSNSTKESFVQKEAKLDTVNLLKEKQFAKEQNEEVQVQLDKTKWQITKKENQNTEIKKENLLSMSSFVQKTEDKVKPEIISYKQEVEIKTNLKPIEIKPEKETFQKSLSDLVQKAKLNIVENGKNSAQISLYPNELGKITLNIDVTREKVDGKILVDNETVKNLILNDITSLKEDLKSSGLNLDSLSVEVKSENGSSAKYSDFAENKNFSESNEKLFSNKTIESIELESANILNANGYSTSSKLVDVKV